MARPKKTYPKSIQNIFDKPLNRCSSAELAKDLVFLAKKFKITSIYGYGVRKQKYAERGAVKSGNFEKQEEYDNVLSFDMQASGVNTYIDGSSVMSDADIESLLNDVIAYVVNKQARHLHAMYFFEEMKKLDNFWGLGVNFNSLKKDATNFKYLLPIGPGHALFNAYLREVKKTKLKRLFYYESVKQLSVEVRKYFQGKFKTYSASTEFRRDFIAARGKKDLTEMVKEDYESRVFFLDDYRKNWNNSFAEVEEESVDRLTHESSNIIQLVNNVINSTDMQTKDISRAVKAILELAPEQNLDKKKVAALVQNYIDEKLIENDENIHLSSQIKTRYFNIINRRTHTKNDKEFLFWVYKRNYFNFSDETLRDLKLLIDKKISDLSVLNLWEEEADVLEFKAA